MCFKIGTLMCYIRIKLDILIFFESIFNGLPAQPGLLARYALECKWKVQLTLVFQARPPPRLSAKPLHSGAAWNPQPVGPKCR